MAASAVPTVLSLVSALAQDLVPVAGFTPAATAISAVHVSELQDPTGYLGGGELLLTTGLALPASRAGSDRYVARLRRAGLAALAIGLGPVHQEPPQALVAACRKHDLMLLCVPVATPFLTITRAYWSALSRASRQHLDDALAAQRALVEAAASMDPVGSVLKLLARYLDGWAATLGPAGGVDVIYPLGMSGQAEALQAQVRRLDVAGTRSAASFIAAGQFVVMFPMAVADRPVGYLAVGTPAQLDATTRRTVLTACALLSLDTMRSRAAETADEAARRCVATLVDLGRVQAAADLASAIGSPALGAQTRVLAVTGRDGAALVAAVRTWCPRAYTVQPDPGSAWFLLPVDCGDLHQLERELAGTDGSAGARLSPAVRLQDVGAVRSRLLSALARAPGTRHLTARVDQDSSAVRERLDVLAGAGAPQLIEATAAYLRHRGHWESAARSLGRHRNTLRYQVSRAREVLDLDMDEPDVAALLWLAMRERGLA